MTTRFKTIFGRMISAGIVGAISVGLVQGHNTPIELFGYAAALVLPGAIWYGIATDRL